jgi:hypothetical protein
MIFITTTNNESRLKETLDSIKDNGYPYKDKYIVLFEGQDIIRDGQHRTAILANLNSPDSKIKVMRFYFEGNKHQIKAVESNVKIGSKWFARKVYRKLKRIIKG